jgi:NAD(P)H-dependent FMN reductase
MSGVLKNAIDWGSRPPNVFDRKVAASFGTTVGAYGTARSQMNVRLCLSPLNVWVVPETVLVPHARTAFDAGGDLADPEVADDLRAVGRVLVQAIRAGLGGCERDGDQIGRSDPPPPGGWGRGPKAEGRQRSG